MNKMESLIIESSVRHRNDGVYTRNTRLTKSAFVFGNFFLGDFLVARTKTMLKQ